ncbi:hypothetical protein INR49_004658 [Caranx melampygus]|nr:hypothetical protein INR49_004658 [Caranx melampygus]
MERTEGGGGVGGDTSILWEPTAVERERRRETTGMYIGNHGNREVQHRHTDSQSDEVASVCAHDPEDDVPPFSEASLQEAVVGEEVDVTGSEQVCETHVKNVVLCWHLCRYVQSRSPNMLVVS